MPQVASTWTWASSANSVVEPLLLFVGEQVDAGVQGAAGPVERIVRAAAVAVDDLLDPAAAPVQGVAGEADHVERVHHRDGVGQLLGGGGLEPGEAVHRDDLDLVPPGRVAFGEPPLEGLFGTALDHVEQPGWAGVVADRGEVDDHGDVLVAAAGVAPDVLIDAYHGDAVEPVRVVDQARWPSARTALLAVFHDTPSPSATRATVRCCTTRPSNAHRSPRRDSFARGSAARLVSWRHTCPHSVQR